MASRVLVGTPTLFTYDNRLMMCKFLYRVLVVLDRLMSASFGRPCAIHEEEYVLATPTSSYFHLNLQLYLSFDIDLPTEVDDEYWENEHDPEQAFKQPPGKPSLLSYFVCFIKLNQILAIALRTIVRLGVYYFWHTKRSRARRSIRLTSQKPSLGL